MLKKTFIYEIGFFWNKVVDDNIEFIEPDEYRGSQDIPFHFIIGRILLNLDATRFSMRKDAYIEGVDALIQRSWHLIDKKNSKWKKELQAIDEKYDKLAEKSTDNFELKFERAKAVERMLMRLLYSMGEVSGTFME